MAVAVLTAHANFRATTRDGFLLQWLEEQGLEITFVADDHLLAADPEQALFLELRAYSLDGGSATQVRWQFSQLGPAAPAETLLERLLDLKVQLEQDSRWHVDACLDGLAPQVGADSLVEP